VNNVRPYKGARGSQKALRGRENQLRREEKKRNGATVNSLADEVSVDRF
jgi:hypothetical protein